MIGAANGQLRVSSDTLTRGMWTRLREGLTRLRGFASRDESPRLSDELRWYTEHTALLISTLKWAMLGAVAGVCVGLGTRVFLWALTRSADWARALTPAMAVAAMMRNGPHKAACTTT